MEDPSPAGFVLWFVGLPGSGKSTLARDVFRRMKDRNQDVVYLQMDEQRKKYFPNPSYTQEERNEAYRLFAEEGADLACRGKGVILDGTAYKRSMREHARKLSPRFLEISVRCSLETAMEREGSRPEGLVMADLYAKALERKRTGRQFENLGQVIGVDVPFEEDPQAECIVQNENLTVDEAVDQVLECVNSRLKNK
ncbi:MAG: adenylyl-sulfate kinase [Desulfovibrionales bacterium]